MNGPFCVSRPFLSDFYTLLDPKKNIKNVEHMYDTNIKYKKFIYFIYLWYVLYEVFPFCFGLNCSKFCSKTPKNDRS